MHCVVLDCIVHSDVFFATDSYINFNVIYSSFFSFRISVCQ